MRKLALAVAMTSAAWGAPAMAAPCDPTSIITGCGTQSGSGFRGAIIVPGSEAANRAVARSGGCAGCDWTLVPDCDHNDVDSRTYAHCAAEICADGTTYRVYLQRPQD